jgi:hypothetical protein
MSDTHPKNPAIVLQPALGSTAAILLDADFSANAMRKVTDPCGNL